MKFFDITVPLFEGVVSWEGDQKFEMTRLVSVSPDDPTTYNLSRIKMSVHLGTHVDAPLHFIHGAEDATELDLDALNGPARVIDLRGHGLAIDRVALESKGLSEGERVLLKTDNCGLYDSGRFTREFVHLTEDGATYLRDKGTRLVGIDYLSVDPWNPPDSGFKFTAHHRLFESRSDRIAPTIVLEGLDLRDVDEGEYELICLPLLIRGAEGAPARAILKKP